MMHAVTSSSSSISDLEKYVVVAQRTFSGIGQSGFRRVAAGRGALFLQFRCYWTDPSNKLGTPRASIPSIPSIHPSTTIHPARWRGWIGAITIWVRVSESTYLPIYVGSESQVSRYWSTELPALPSSIAGRSDTPIRETDDRMTATAFGSRSRRRCLGRILPDNGRPVRLPPPPSAPSPSSGNWSRDLANSPSERWRWLRANGPTSVSGRPVKVVTYVYLSKYILCNHVMSCSIRDAVLEVAHLLHRYLPR